MARVTHDEMVELGSRRARLKHVSDAALRVLSTVDARDFSDAPTVSLPDALSA